MKEVCIDNLNQKEREEAVNEIRLLASFRHSNIVRYCDAFISDNMLCIVRTSADNQPSPPQPPPPQCSIAPPPPLPLPPSAADAALSFVAEAV